MKCASHFCGVLFYGDTQRKTAKFQKQSSRHTNKAAQPCKKSQNLMVVAVQELVVKRGKVVAFRGKYAGEKRQHSICSMSPRLT